MPIFEENKIYSWAKIIDICNHNRLITVDCLKDENMISVERKDKDCLFEFSRIKENPDLFKLTWAEEE